MQVDFSDIRSQEAAKRALLVALVGGHSVALVGPHGHGKTMLLDAAKCVGGLGDTFEVTLNGRHEPAAEPSFDLKMAARADIHCEVPPVPFRELMGRNKGTDTKSIQAKAEAARAYRDPANGRRSSDLSESCLSLLKQAYTELGMSAACVVAVKRIARSVADLEQSDAIQEFHLAEAVQYRLLSRAKF